MSKRTLGVVFFPAFDWAISPTHPEREERLLYTQDQLREEGLFDLPGITEYKPGVATYEDIERVHFCLPDVGRVCSASHLASAGGAIRAGELVLSGERERAFALVRPPGHHAMRVTHGNRGFCNVNMEAVMIENLRRRFGPLRVAIVDTDCHHGDGTQDIYWNDPDTLFISMHQDGRTLYPGTGFLPECGGPGALGRTVNIPLPPGTGDEGYLYVTKNVVLPLLEAFKPDLVINSAGQDNHYTDPLTNMQLSAHGYAAMNALLNPHIAVLEGGYSIRGALPYVNLGICLALAGLPFEHVHEPDHDAKALKQRPQVTEYISRLCDDVLNQYHNPPSRPSEGHRDGEWWRRERDIYYDTDGLSEHQNEGIRLCPDCPGLTCIETSSDRVDKSLCLLLPRNACPHCRALAHRLVETTGKKSGRYAHVLCIWSDNKLYGNKLNDRIQEYSQATKVTPLLMPSIDELLAQGITKILWYDDVSQIQQIEKELRKTAHFHNVTFCTSKPFYLEFFNSKVSKAAAIDCIGKLYDFTPAETIAIGDGFNDLSMIRYAALGVAMENAPDGVKESADYITARTNNEDGVAEVLEKFVL